MNQERLYKIILGPVISEKSTTVAETGNQVVFKVTQDAQKPEIKEAIETLFNVTVEQVRVLNVKGKTKRTRYGMGVRSDWKKAYIRLVDGQEIDFEESGIGGA
jgi:large subunit ribosomal protein L23